MKKAQARVVKVLRLPPELVEAVDQKLEPMGTGLFNAYVTHLIEKDLVVVPIEEGA